MTLQEALNSLPPVRSSATPKQLQCKIVVLDDDPTGSQTVHNIPVLTSWNIQDLASELGGMAPGFFILTNTRALSPEAAALRNQEIGTALKLAAQQVGKDFTVISRGDSTLRGHYPCETDALTSALGGAFAGTVLVPAFMAGGRFTIEDVHYVAEGTRLVPVGETEFARDRSFGFQASNVRDYVAEKTGGRVKAADVMTVSITDIRVGGPVVVANKLAQLTDGRVAVVNAAAPEDFFVLSEALAQPALRNRRLLYRTAADFVAAVFGQRPQPPLPAVQLRTGSGGGLLVAGSYVGRTSLQLDALFASCPAVMRIEAEVGRLVDPDFCPAEIARCRDLIDRELAAGRSSILFTSRGLLTGADAASSLELGARISSALVKIVSGLRQRPDWFVAKGGITSSDLATEALQIRRALVLGQAQPGVPVWLSGPGSKWPNLPYIVFPGNVGSGDALANLVVALEAARCNATPPLSAQPQM